jgi:hypothetical protein
VSLLVRTFVADPCCDGRRGPYRRAPGEHASVLFIVDEEATAADFPVLVVHLSPTARNAFRCIARELWGVDNNLNLADMEWDEFASSTGSDGVVRGFRE